MVPLVWFLLTVFAVFLISFLPGYLILLRFASSLNDSERLASSFGVSFGILAFVAFIGYLTKVWWLGPLLVLLLSLFLLLDCKTKKLPVWPKSAVFWLFLLFYLHALLFQVATPYYDKVAYGDWWMHYEISRFYLGHGESVFFGGYSTVTSRTPLFNLANSFFMSAFGGQFWVFQIGSTLMNSAFLLSIWLLSKKLFPKASAVPVLVFGLFNTYLLRNATYTWPKLLAAYFVILALYYYLKQRDSKTGLALSGLFAGLAYMSHQFTIVYIAGLGIDYFIFSNEKSMKKFATLFVLPFLLVSLPWHLWAVSAFGLAGAFLSYPSIFTKYGMVPMEFLSKKLAQLYDFNSHPIITWVIFRLSDIGFTLIPIQPLMDILRTSGSFFNFYYAILAYYLGTIPGALTTSLTLLFLFLRRKLHIDRSTMLVMIAGFFGSVILQPPPMRSGLASTSMYPIILILLVLVGGLFGIANKNVKILVLGGMLLEFFAMSWTQIYFAPHLPTDIGNNVLKIQQNVQTMAWDYLGASQLLPIIFSFIVVIELIFFMVYWRTNYRKLSS